MASKAQRKRSQPKSPEQIAAEKLARRMQDFSAVDMQPGAAALTANGDVLIERGNQEHVERARRLDAFEALKADMNRKAPGAYDAARRLERDIIIRRGEHDHGRPPEKVDGAIISAYCRNDQIIAAAERVNAVMRGLSDRDAWLLRDLIVLPPNRDHWREVVSFITGETHTHAQGAAVRAACVNLRDAYERLERKAA
jgi:hypothetical protein